MLSLNLLTCLLFITININLIFGFPSPFTSQGHEYEINYSQGGKHVITNVNGEEEELITSDHSLNGQDTKFFTDEIEEYPGLLKYLGFNLPPNHGKIPSLGDIALLTKGDTQYIYRPSSLNTYNSIHKKLDSPAKNSALKNFHLLSPKNPPLKNPDSSSNKNPASMNLYAFNGVNPNDQFPRGLYSISVSRQDFLSEPVVESQNSSKSNFIDSPPEKSGPNEFEITLPPNFVNSQQHSQNILDAFLSNSKDYNKQKNSEGNIKVSKRNDIDGIIPSPTYIFINTDDDTNNNVKQTKNSTQGEKQIDNSIEKSDSSLNGTQKPVKPIIDTSCDDGKTNLQVDWDGSKSDFVCNADTEILTNDLPSTKYCDPSVSVIQPKTRCMNETLEYSELIPVIGDYRPVAPQLGEYKYIPKQRWLNSLDNNAVVLLYHPCAERSAVDKLRLLVMKYYERYIFTPYNLEATAPFAIVTKGCRLVMSHVVANEVAHFLQDHGPPKVPLGKPNYRELKYNLGLIEESRRHHIMGLPY